MPRRRPTVDVSRWLARLSSSRNVGICVGTRNEIVWHTKVAA